MQADFVYNYWDYAYRGLTLIAFVAKSLGDAAVVEEGVKFIRYFEKTTGDTGSGDPEKFMKKVKRKNA